MLKHVENIGSVDGFDVVIMDKLREQFPERFTESGQMDWEWFEKEIRPNKFVYVRLDKNSLSFTLQNGPIKEVGVNGCQIDTVISMAYALLNSLNMQHQCKENELALSHLQSALQALKDRKSDREARGVEGTSLA
jgi:hypothetical protein